MWVLTVYDKRNRIVQEEEEYKSLNDIAKRFGLSRGSDLAFYRLQPEERAREMELKDFGVWFKIIEEDSGGSSSSGETSSESSSSSSGDSSSGDENGDDCD